MMEKHAKEQLKAELKKELAQDIADQIEDEVEEEVQEEIREYNRSRKALGLFKNYFIAIAATIIALGQFSEAVTLIEAGIDWARSKVTHSVEYELLSQIHVGNTQPYIESLLGYPQVSRTIDANTTANYFENEKFLLTIFLAESRVSGFTVIPLQADFMPEVLAEAGQSWNLQEFTYASFPANPQLYLVDHSKTTSYYLEALDTGRAGLFFKTYLGNVALNTAESSMRLVELYNKDISAGDEEILKAQDSLRSEIKPNLFGLGTLTLEQVQKSILTGAEFSNFFGR